MERSSGILLPIFSLPSKYGIGTLGREAKNFVDFLSSGGQKYWQILPLGPTGFGDSPYQCFSSYAGNPYFIDLEDLIGEGWLKRDEVEEIEWSRKGNYVDYQTLYNKRQSVLRKAFSRFSGGPYDNFQPAWLEDYSLYMAVKNHFNMKAWYSWEDGGISKHRHEAVEKYSNLLSDEIQYHRFTQYIFFKQWNSLRAYAMAKGIKFIGDLPIYIAMDSADAWTSVDVLQFDEKGKPSGLGGVPPDYFSKSGQLWGNPLYDWDAMNKDGYNWWMKRIGGLAEMFDSIRLDHFRGFDSYWKVPFGQKTAIQGKWLPGPGIGFIYKLKETYPSLHFIAEDLGLLNSDVHKLVKQSAFPGMKVIQFAFSRGGDSDHLPHRYCRNSVVYTGTHDNTTIRGWLEEEASHDERRYAEKYFNLQAQEKWNWGIIKGAMRSVADLCIIPIQDYLDLPSDARINTPGTLGANWQWRLKKGQLTEQLAEKIRETTTIYGR